MRNPGEIAAQARPTAGLWLFALTIFVSAFLLFQVQPLISKQILPWFGGSPAVWTTAMLFFQSVLFAGYLYAHLLSRLPSRRLQALIHVALLAVAAVAAGAVLPGHELKPVDEGEPAWQVLAILARSVGLPYFCLATTGPLVQHWFTHTAARGSVFRLYALSNIGSFLALLSFPYVFEPWLDLREMAATWAWGFWAFAALCTPIALGWAQRPLAATMPRAAPVAPDTSPPVSTADRLAWISLPALASLMFIAVTDQISHDIAPEPRVWITTLGLYLLTIVLTFDHPRWYRPGLMAALVVLCILLTTGRSDLPDWFGLTWDYGVTEMRGMHYLLLFAVCMLCHGELYSRRPTSPRQLTAFYLWMSLGGAFGGLFVTLVATPLFNDYHEWPLGLALALALAVAVAMRQSMLPPRAAWPAGVGAAVLLVGMVLHFEDPWGLRDQGGEGRIVMRLEQSRNFYGTILVEERRHPGEPGRDYRIFHSGQIDHGQQFLAADKRHVPSTYYAVDSGVGETLGYLKRRDPAVDVALIGLGAGTLATYARAADRYDFFEINPDAVRIAQAWFDNLAACAAREKNILVGDARLRIERLPPQKKYDLIVLDAFTGGSVPVHLLTREAFQAYEAHLKPDGFIAIHITNSWLNLYPVVKAQAQALGMGFRSKYQTGDPARHVRRNHYFIMTRDATYLAEHPSVNEEHADGQGRLIRPEEFDRPGLPLWTDQFSSIQPLEW